MTEMAASPIQLSIEQLVDFCQRHRISRLAVFGSAQRGEERPDSDMDILVRFEPDAAIGFIAFSRIQRELEELLNRPVDLVTEAGLRPLMREEILRTSQELYAA